MTEYKCFDNLLDEPTFSRLQNVLLSRELPWYWAPYTAVENDENNNQFYFGHNIYHRHSWVSRPVTGAGKETCVPFEEMAPLIQKINPMAIHTIRANCMTKSDSHIECQLHSDMDQNAPTPDTNKINQWTTAVYYINDCNGYTKFKDGTVIESKSNRLLTFPANTKHLGATCTDQKRRVVINFNYIL
tara:strand:+ start:305 stop:865 length:561 start_codon:yes stop_codon:yes gene_type:complete